MYRFALRGRWLAGLILILVVAATCIRLGIWQLDRLDQRRAFNERVEERSRQEIAPFGDLVPEGARREDLDAVEYRRVELTGMWDRDHEIVVRGQAYNGSPGQHVVTPLLLADGTGVLVNRGFVPQVELDAAVPPEAKPPAGEVTVVGVLRAGSVGGQFDPAPEDVATLGTVGYANRVDPEVIGRNLSDDLAAAYVRVEAAQPTEQGLPIPLLPPPMGEGPHLGYALQWFSFAAIFLGGWPILLRRVAHRKRGVR